ncbi:hypothetical protein BKA69DRAFT_780002 [Paraphysoderma sedebokerense]|nr:hypothetical protein BKA69DRAFT_780002 [Paraphysoderma sedebokerense]
MVSSWLLYKNGSKNYNPLMLVSLMIVSLVVNAFGQSIWQDVTTFHPYCVRLFKSCVDSSSIAGVGSGNYTVAVGICGNKMAMCTFSGTLTWPWSSNISGERPASASVDATTKFNYLSKHFGITGNRNIYTLAKRDSFFTRL